MADVALTPAKVYEAASRAAAAKAAQPLGVTLVLGFSAGALIGMGAALMTSVGASSPELFKDNVGEDNFLKGAIGLPAGLTLVVLTGAELFTSNVFTMLAGVLQGQVKATDLLRNWAVSYAGNFIGSIFLALLVWEAGIMAPPALHNGAIAVANLKASFSFSAAFCRGIVCNWLVCLAIWCAMCSPSVAGKILGIFWPISMFVALGTEHCVANMYLIPQGMLAGADISVWKLFCNIVPVTLGNMVGAAVFVAGIGYFAYGCPGSFGNCGEEEATSDEDGKIEEGYARQIMSKGDA